MVQKYNSLRILLTGSNGMLGSNYLSLSSNLFDVIPTSSTNKSFAYLDLTDSNNVKSVLNTYMPNIIVNCSAITDVDGAELDKKKAYDVNVNGIRNIIKYSDVDTKIIHISSDYVFNGLSGNYSEKSRPDPINYYGKTKLESENILVSSNRKYLLFRVNGLFSFDYKYNFYTWVYNKLNNKKPINIADDQFSNPTFVNSFVNIINQLIMLDTDGLYHYGSNDIISRYEFAMQIADFFNFNSDLIFPITTSDLDQIAKRPLKTNLICTKIKNVLDLELDTVTSILNNKS